MSLVKRVNITSRKNVEVRFNVLNVFDPINFTPVAQVGSGATINQVTAAYTDASNTFDPGGRLGELVFRITW